MSPSDDPFLAYLDDDEVKHCLVILALCAGDSRKAASRLRKSGFDSVTAKNLTTWRETFPDLYEDIVETEAPRIGQAQALELEELAATEGKITKKLLRAIESDLPNMNGKDAAIVLSHLEKSKSLNIDKARTARNLPTRITQDRSIGELIEHLQKKFGNVVELPSELVDVTSDADASSSPAPKLPA